jgi:hypothetical protein
MINRKYLSSSSGKTISEFKKIVMDQVENSVTPENKLNILFDAAETLFRDCRNSNSIERSLETFDAAKELLSESECYARAIVPNLYFNTRVRILELKAKKAREKAFENIANI